VGSGKWEVGSGKWEVGSSWSPGGEGTDVLRPAGREQDTRVCSTL